MTDPTRLTYLLNHCAGFMPTRDQWQEVVKLGNAMLLDRAHLCQQINLNEQLARDEQKKRQEYEDSYRRVMTEECAPDERHCTCVPALRAEIALLKQAIRAMWPIFALALAYGEHRRTGEHRGLIEMAEKARNGGLPPGVLDTILNTAEETT